MHYIGVDYQLQTAVGLTPGNELTVTDVCKARWTQSLSGRPERQKHLLTMLGTKPRFSGCTGRSLGTILTALPRLWVMNNF